MSSFFDELAPDARKELLDCLQPMQFSKGQCLMKEGEEGDGCYLIDEGEVRLEIGRVDTHSENVLCHLPAGAVLGEFCLLDGQPRSASAYAHTDVKVRWLSRTDFQNLCLARPELGVSILTQLARQLTGKLRHQNDQVAEHLFSGEADAETEKMVLSAVEAQNGFAAWSEERVDALLQEIATTVMNHSAALAEVNVADTGIGVVADKIQKIGFACQEVCKTLIGRQASGVLDEQSTKHKSNIACPVGVVLGIIPVTNPVSTIVFKTLICLKGRNALILSCHRDVLRVGNMVGELIHEVMAKHGAPLGLVQWIKNRTDRRKTAMFMRHPHISFILATGGPSIVQASYSSGKPAIGVGAGNAPVLICADADLAAAAEHVVKGKSFDNGVICGSENNLVVVNAVRTQFIEHLKACGALVVSPDGKHRLMAHMFEAGGSHLKRDVVGKSAALIAEQIGLDAATPPRLLIVPVGLDELNGPFGHEKLAPVLSLFTVADEDEGLEVCRRILEQQGIGHTAVIHTQDEAMAHRFGLEMQASRILVNATASLGCIGFGTDLTPSFTLGCGTYGGNSTSDNVTYTHVLNIKRLAFAH